ncbi:hypothetical protein C8R46DRAFT_1229315 [Mycena filopes]|nr:hypothetical protein C8R46DRAFT_1229315 [Mycena filopes]
MPGDNSSAVAKDCYKCYPPYLGPWINGFVTETNINIGLFGFSNLLSYLHLHLLTYAGVNLYHFLASTVNHLIFNFTIMRIQKSRSLVTGGILADSKRSSNLAWISPLPTDIYAPGSEISAKWSSNMIDSPVFKLCKVSTGSDSRRDTGSSDLEPGGCGEAVSPAILESAGIYQTTVTMPDDVPAAAGYYLIMEDRFENKMRSPVFTLSPDGASTSEPLAGVDPQAQAPFAPAGSPVASPSSIASPLYPGSPATSSAFAPPSLPSAFSQVFPTPTFNPNALSAKSAPSPVVFAVPLSAVAAIVLVASALLIKHRRKMAAQRALDTQRPSRASSYKSSASHGNGSEVDHALHVLSRHHGHGYSRDRKPRLDALPYPTYARWNPPPSDDAAYQRNPNPPAYPAQYPPHREQRPRLPPIATSFMSSASDPPTHAVLADYILPSPPLRPSASTPRCLLPAPQQLHLRDNAGRDNPLGSPPADRDRELYAQVESKLSMYRPHRHN